MKSKKEIEPDLFVSGRIPTEKEFDTISETIRQAKAKLKANKTRTGKNSIQKSH